MKHKLWQFELPIILLVFFANRMSKLWVVDTLPFAERVPLIPGFVSFFYVTNTGAAFGILSGQRMLFTAVSVMVLFGILLLRRELTEDRLSLKLAWSLIVAGTAGNLYDRLLSGEVVDFLAFDFMDFGIFNLADVALCTGFALYLLVGMLSGKPKHQGSEAGDGSG